MTNSSTPCPGCDYEDALAKVRAYADELGTRDRFEVSLRNLFPEGGPAHRAECPNDPTNLRHSCGCYMEDNMGGHAPDCDSRQPDMRPSSFDEPYDMDRDFEDPDDLGDLDD